MVLYVIFIIRVLLSFIESLSLPITYYQSDYFQIN